jgi:hypothetical protein
MTTPEDAAKDHSPLRAPAISHKERNCDAAK